MRDQPTSELAESAPVHANDQRSGYSLKRHVRRRSAKERSHIETLKRRLDYLAVRVASSDYGKVNHDRREMAALLWAINEIEPPNDKSSHTAGGKE